MLGGSRLALLLLPELAAVVLIVIVVTPPEERDAGENEQVASLPAGGVHPKLTDPANPPEMFSNIVTLPLVPPDNVSAEGTIVRL